MQLFTIIDDATAIIRQANGVYKQAKVYHRGGRVFVGHSGGFLRVTANFGGTWGTSNPNVKVEALEGDGIDAATNKEPSFKA